jgi:hypothetical protein
MLKDKQTVTLRNMFFQVFNAIQGPGSAMQFLASNLVPRLEPYRDIF